MECSGGHGKGAGSGWTDLTIGRRGGKGTIGRVTL